MNKRIVPQVEEDVKSEDNIEARRTHEVIVELYRLYQGKIRLNMEYCFKIGDMFNEGRMWESRPKDMIVSRYGEGTYKQWCLMARVARKWSLPNRKDHMAMPWRWFVHNDPSGVQEGGMAAPLGTQQKEVTVDECDLMRDGCVRVVITKGEKKTVITIPSVMVEKIVDDASSVTRRRNRAEL